MSNSGTYKSHAPNTAAKAGAGTSSPAAASADDSKAAKPGETEAKTGVADGAAKPTETPQPKEIGGPKGPEPTRFGDWERGGRCVDF